MKKALLLILSVSIAFILLLPCNVTSAGVLEPDTGSEELGFDVLPFDGYEIPCENIINATQSNQKGSAKANGKAFGDVDRNGKVQANDILSLMNDLAGNSTDATPISTTFSDVNFDSEIDMLDVVTLQRHVAGWEGYEKLPYGADVYAGSEDYMPDVLYYEPIIEIGGFAYDTLNATQKAFYEDIVTAVQNMDDSLIYSNLSSVNELLLCYFAVRIDHPEFFWLSNRYGYTQYAPYALQIDYSLDKQQKLSYEAEIKESLQEVVDYIGDTDYSDYELETLIHDYLAKNITYNGNAASTGDTVSYPNAWNVYGALVNNSSVCEGYAESFMMIMQMFGVKTGISIGSVHMWNYIVLDDEFYYVDVTWDDPDVESLIYYEYFNVTYEQILKSRSFYPLYQNATLNDLCYGTFNVFIPICSATKYNPDRYGSTVLNSNTTLIQDMANGFLSQTADAYSKGLTVLNVKFFVENGSGINALNQSQNVLDAISLANSKLRYYRIIPKTMNVNYLQTVITVSVELI